MIKINQTLHKLKKGTTITTGAYVDTVSEISHPRIYDENGNFVQRDVCIKTWLIVYADQNHYEDKDSYPIAGPSDPIDEFDTMVMEVTMTEAQFDLYDNADFETNVKDFIGAFNDIVPGNVVII